MCGQYSSVYPTYNTYLQTQQITFTWDYRLEVKKIFLSGGSMANPFCCTYCVSMIKVHEPVLLGPNKFIAPRSDQAKYVIYM